MEEQILNMSSFYRSILEQDRASVVICNLNHEIIYMNPQAIRSYEKRGGEKLITHIMKLSALSRLLIPSQKAAKAFLLMKNLINLSLCQITKK